jgi:hypothetical protein
MYRTLLLDYSEQVLIILAARIRTNFADSVVLSRFVRNARAYFAAVEICFKELLFLKRWLSFQPVRISLCFVSLILTTGAVTRPLNKPS